MAHIIKAAQWLPALAFSGVVTAVPLLTPALANAQTKPTAEQTNPAPHPISFCKNMPAPVSFKTVTPFGGLVAENGQTFRLADLYIRREKSTGHFSSAAVAWLKTNVSGRRLIILNSGKTDRYGRHFAHLLARDHTWLQAEMIKAGHAQFMPWKIKKSAKNRARCDDDAVKQALRSVDDNAYEASQSVGRISHPVDSRQRFGTDDKILWKMAGNFVIVEGIVVAVAKLRSGTAINFGKDWKTDFTAFLRTDLARRMEKTESSLSKMVGKKIRLRGFLDLYNGPNMPINHLSQMELLDK